jgi:hypothetical protein
MKASKWCFLYLVLGLSFLLGSAKDHAGKTAGFADLENGICVAILENGDLYARGSSVRSSTFIWLGDGPHLLGNFWFGRKAPKSKIVGFDYCCPGSPPSIDPYSQYRIYSVILEDGRFFVRETDSTGVGLGPKPCREDEQRGDFWGITKNKP